MSFSGQCCFEGIAWCRRHPGCAHGGGGGPGRGRHHPDPGCLGPIQLVLLGIAAAMDFVKKGSGDAVTKVAEDMQGFVNKGYSLTNSWQAVPEGKNAIASMADARLDADMKLANLGKKSAAEARGERSPRPRSSRS